MRPDRLLAGAADLGITLSEAQQAAFARYFRALADWNRRVNLTSVDDWESVQTVHFLDSLSVASALPRDVLDGGRVLDVGSGAGFPGLPLKIAYPGLRVALLESVGKKAAFLRAAVDLLALQRRRRSSTAAPRSSRTGPICGNPSTQCWPAAWRGCPSSPSSPCPSPGPAAWSSPRRRATSRRS